jgi:hypothetical protein
MKVARILQVLGVLTAIFLLSGQDMVLAGNDTTLQGKSLSDVELQSFHGMGWSFNLSQQNYPSGTNNNQVNNVSGTTATGQPYTASSPTPSTQTISIKKSSPTASAWNFTFQHHP